MRRWSNGDVPSRTLLHLCSEFEGEEHPCNVVPINTSIKIHWRPCGAPFLRRQPSERFGQDAVIKYVENVSPLDLGIIFYTLSQFLYQHGQ
jgi:hypothetical protein